jgi:hypothetical protein
MRREQAGKGINLGDDNEEHAKERKHRQTKEENDTNQPEARENQKYKRMLFFQ